MKNEELIIEIIKEIKVDTKENAKSLAEHREDSLIWKNKTDFRLEKIEIDLREHKEGVVNNRHLIKKASDRLNKLEEPSKARKYGYKVMIGIGAVAAAIYAVLRLFGLVI